VRATGVPPKPAICQSPIWLSALHTSNCADECGVGYATSHPYPGQIWVLFLLFTNWFRRQPGRPPDELAAGLVHAIRQVASYPRPTRLPGVNTLLFVSFSHLPCVYFVLCVLVCYLSYFGLDTGLSSLQALGRKLALNVTLAPHLATRAPSCPWLGLCKMCGPQAASISMSHTGHAHYSIFKYLNI
jgi:hypothetical protein